MAILDPLQCLGAVFMAGTTTSPSEEPIWRKAAQGIFTGLAIALVSGASSGAIASYVALNELTVKMEAIMDRIREDRAYNREEMMEIRKRVRDLEKIRR